MDTAKSSLPTFLHWFAWTISVVSSVFFVVFMTGEDIPNVLAGRDKELIPFLVCLGVAIIGCFLSFFRRNVGAWMMLTGGTAMIVAVALQSGMNEFRMMISYGLPYVFPGMILLMVKK